MHRAALMTTGFELDKSLCNNAVRHPDLSRQRI